MKELTADELEFPAYRLSPLPSGYQPVTGRAAVIRWGILVLTILSGAQLGALVAQYQALRTGIEITSAGARVADVARALWLVGGFTAFVAVIWLRRVYLNLGPLGVRRPHFGPGAPGGRGLVPLINVIPPKQLMDDIWRGSDPTAPLPINEWWRAGPVPTWVHIWWGLWVAAAALWLTAIFLGGSDASKTSVALMEVSAVMAILAGPLFWLLVGRVTKRQDARALRVGADEWVRPKRFAPERPVLAVAGVVTAAVMAFGVMTWPVVASETKATPDGDRYAGYGVSFAFPFGFAVTETGLLATGDPDESTGEVLAARLHRDDSVIVRWVPAEGRSGDFGALVEVLGTTTDEVIAEWGPSIFHGRPLEVTVDGQVGIIENFSLNSGTNLAYAMVTVVECAATDRLLTVVVVADTSKTIRRALTGLVLPSARC